MAFKLRRKKPQYGDKVWLGSRIEEGLQPNGRIVSIDYTSDEVIIVFYDKNRGPPTVLEIEDIEFNWTDKLGGLYLVQQV